MLFLFTKHLALSTLYRPFPDRRLLARGVELLGNAQMVLEPGLSFRFSTALTLTAGAFLAVWFAELITRKGIGHGISVLFLSGILARGIPFYLPRFKEYYQENTLLCFAAMILLVIALFVAVFYIEKSYREITVRLRDGMHVAMPLKLTTAGITTEHQINSA